MGSKIDLLTKSELEYELKVSFIFIFRSREKISFVRYILVPFYRKVSVITVRVSRTVTTSR